MLLLGLTLALQAPTPPPVRPVDSAAVPINGVYLIVNEEVVTQREFLREAERRGFLATTDRERQRIFVENYRDFVERTLMTQAGRDAGFPEDRISAMVERDVRELVEDQGGASRMGSMLEEGDTDIDDYRAAQRDLYFATFWQYSIDGRTPGVSGRTHVDRYVSPSELHYLYRRQPADRIFPATVQFQELLISARAAGSAQGALDRIEELHVQALGGADFGKLVAEHHSETAARNRKGLLEPMPIEEARARLPGLAQFIESAEPGAISDPAPVRVDGELRAFRLLRLVERVRRDAPTFGEADVQVELRRRHLASLTEWRRAVGLSQLHRAAYIWPNEAAEGSTQAAPQAETAPH
jgi:hypothetical protein